MRRRKRRGEVTLHDFLTLLLILLGGLMIASYGGQLFGWPGFLLGIPMGLIATFGVLYGVALVAACLEALLWTGMPVLPPCGTGKCRSGLLTDFGDFEPEQVGGQWGYFRCRCGKLYFRERKKGRVSEVLPDGTQKPYMIWKPLRGWHPDSTAMQSDTQSTDDRPA